MINEIYNLYKKNLPDIIRSKEAVINILKDENNYIQEYRENGKLTGVSVINENTIYLLCIDKEYQNKGIGSKLLNQSEEYIASKGYDKAVLGAGKDYIMPGAPMNNNKHTFFKNRGYIHSWGDSGCYDMCQNLSELVYNEHSIGDTIKGITYRWATENDFNNIIKCVSNAEEDFVQYYNDKNLYNRSNTPSVLIAVKDKEVSGTLMINVETEGKGIGSVACTTTMVKHRNQGIATNLVMLGTRYLKDIGLDKAFLGYTYTDIVKMYGRAGYKICMEYYMGEKVLSI